MSQFLNLARAVVLGGGIGFTLAPATAGTGHSGGSEEAERVMAELSAEIQTLRREIAEIREEIETLRHQRDALRAERDALAGQRERGRVGNNDEQEPNAEATPRQPTNDLRAQLDLFLALRALSEEWQSPDQGALLGIELARAHLEPRQRIDVLSMVLRDIERPAMLRNAAYAAMIETSEELGHHEETAELIKRMISENARRWR